jgi:hypothetical protein
MQKIQFYLVPNIIQVSTDRAGFTTENRKVYQRTIKLYKGIDNFLQLDVRNVEYRKEDVVGKTADVNFYDSEQNLLFTITATPIVAHPGQMELTVPAATLANIDPQKLTMAAKLDDSGTDRMLYIDTQFGLHAGVQVLDGFNEKLADGDEYQQVTTFNYEFDLNHYVSSLIPFGIDQNDDIFDPTRTIDLDIVVDKTSSFTGDIEIQATKQLSTAFGNTWTTIQTVNVAGADTTVTNLTNDNNYTYIRLLYPKYIPNTDNLAGLLDKVLVRN